MSDPTTPPLPRNNQDAESLFRTKPISEIRTVESSTRKQIQSKSEQLRQLVGNRYRDLIDSADSIVLMKSSCESISSNISSIHHSILHSLTSPADSPRVLNNPSRPRIYGIACRVKYLVDTPENIWGCLDESMFLESSARYIRAKHVHYNLFNINENRNVLSNFPLLTHQWQIVESFKTQISQRSRERLLGNVTGSGIGDFADALAAVAITDELGPEKVLTLFMESRKAVITQKLNVCRGDLSVGSEGVISVFCEVLRVIQVTIGQVGELFLQVLNDMPLFYKVILGFPPASQLFGGIPNPDEEVRLWNLFRDKLETEMGLLDREFVSRTCSEWLRNCGREIMSNASGRYLIDVIGSGVELSSAERLIRETMDSKQVLEGSLEWLKNVFGSEIELPWKRTRELVLGEDSDLWDDIFEDAFVQRMKTVIESGFDELSRMVNVEESVQSVAEIFNNHADSRASLNRLRNVGGVWFTEANTKKLVSVPNSKANQHQEYDVLTCLNAYFGQEVTRIRDAVDSCCKSSLHDLLRFLESPKAPSRLKDLTPFIQNKCYLSLSMTLTQLKNELDQLYSGLENRNKSEESAVSPAILVEKSLFIGRLLFAFQKHSRHIPMVLGSPRSWLSEISNIQEHSIDSTANDASRRHMSLVASALFGITDSSSPHLNDLTQTTQDLCIRAYNLWITWVSDEFSVAFSRNLKLDETLTSAANLRGWEETVVKQDQSESEGQSDMKIYLPSMPSVYLTSLLFNACEEIYRVGGHVLDRIILQNLASRLLDKVMGAYEDFLLREEAPGSQVSEKGILQVLLDLKFAADILSGGDLHANEDTSKLSKSKSPFRRRQEANRTKSAINERTDRLIIHLSQRLDPIDWLTYEPYLWENERQAYLSHGVLFGFFVQLNRLYVETVQKLPTNVGSNTMRCSTVPRFTYLPISAPALSSRNTARSSGSTSMDDVYSRNSWKSYDEISRNIDADEDSGLGVAAPFLKSFMQVGSRFGESTLRLGSILTDGQVGRFGDILPAQAAGLLSSFTARSDV